jgi:hypothetical protein
LTHATDLERRLREYRPTNEWGDPVHHVICDEAADEIARLRAENEVNLAAMLWAAEEFDEERGETPDGWFGHCRKNIVAGVSEEHCGDCTNVPQSCMKCWADHYLARARTALKGPSHE